MGNVAPAAALRGLAAAVARRLPGAPAPPSTSLNALGQLGRRQRVDERRLRIGLERQHEIGLGLLELVAAAISPCRARCAACRPPASEQAFLSHLLQGVFELLLRLVELDREVVIVHRPVYSVIALRVLLPAAPAIAKRPRTHSEVRQTRDERGVTTEKHGSDLQGVWGGLRLRRGPIQPLEHARSRKRPAQSRTHGGDAPRPSAGPRAPSSRYWRRTARAGSGHGSWSDVFGTTAAPCRTASMSARLVDRCSWLPGTSHGGRTPIRQLLVVGRGARWPLSVCPWISILILRVLLEDLHHGVEDREALAAGSCPCRTRSGSAA